MPATAERRKSRREILIGTDDSARRVWDKEGREEEFGRRRSIEQLGTQAQAKHIGSAWFKV